MQFQFLRQHLRHFYLLATLLSMAVAGCSDHRVAGTSSGVDNPQLTVAFRDGDGVALRVTGDLNIYGQDQNPAVDPQPLWTLKLKSTALTNLTGDDIDRINSGGLAKSGAGKRSANQTSGRLDLDADSILSFNLQLKTEERTGTLTFGLSYNAKTKVFTRTGVTNLSRLEIRPKPLIRFAGHIPVDSANGTISRLFIPGTPFQTTLVDSLFIFEDLPEGVFNLRLLDDKGRIFAMMDPLNTDSTAADQTRRFIPGKEPLGKLDSVHVALLDSGLGIQVAPNREVFIEVPSILEAKLINVEANNPRLSILWRQVETSDDSTLNRALISNPTSLRTEVQFFTEGVYHFEVSATLGLIEKRDTLLISVRHAPPPPRPRVIQPRPNDSLPTGKPTNIVWEMPIRGPVSIRFSPNGGGKWMPVVEHFIHPDSLQIFNWIPPVDAAGTTNCVIEVRLDADTLMVAHSVGPFTLLPK